MDGAPATLAKTARPSGRSRTWLRVRQLVPVCLAALACGEVDAPASAAPREQVILLHGLGRTSSSMEALAEKIEAAGFEAHNLDYPSTDAEPEALVEVIEAAVERCCARRVPAIHFVTHSLGGILVRAYLAATPPERLGRVVMLAPPNRGSEIVDAMGESWLFEATLGPTAVELGTDDESLPNRLGPPAFELGVIAGRSSINPVGELLVPGEHDGTVSVESTRLDGMADFLIVDANHTFIMQDEAVAAQVIRFLRTGRFDHGPQAAPAPSRERDADGEGAPSERNGVGPDA